MEILRAVDCSFRRTLVDPDLTPYMEEQFADPEMKITEYDLTLTTNESLLKAILLPTPYVNTVDYMQIMILLGLSVMVLNINLKENRTAILFLMEQ